MKGLVRTGFFIIRVTGNLNEPSRLGPLNRARRAPHATELMPLNIAFDEMERGRHARKQRINRSRRNDCASQETWPLVSNDMRSVKIFATPLVFRDFHGYIAMDIRDGTILEFDILKPQFADIGTQDVEGKWSRFHAVYATRNSDEF